MRRVFLPNLSIGQVELPAPQAHHLRDVLRVAAGEQIELFDGQGGVAVGQIVEIRPAHVTVRIDQISAAPKRRTHLTIAAAVPKGARADWMIEKLCEIGVDVFVPLISQRSVVVPAGTKKLDRWNRLAEQAARQAGRSDVMRIQTPATPPQLLAAGDRRCWYLSVDAAGSMLDALTSFGPSLTLLVGPEGGWVDAEKQAMDSAGALAVRLTSTVLRVETAAVVAAGIVQSALTAAPPPATIPQRGQENCT